MVRASTILGPARYFSEKINSLESELTEPQLDRFREAFKALNSLL